jgi:hypothetical protein
MKLVDIVSYSVILAVLITTGYTLLLIDQFGIVNVTEPNRFILVIEIFLVGLGISFTGYKMIGTLI